MRIHMLSIGTTGDVMPMILIGEELSRRGHTVRIAAFEPLGKAIRAAGLEFYCLPGDAYKYIGTLIQPGGNPVTFVYNLTKSIKALVEPLTSALMDASQGADAIVLTYFGSMGYSIAEKLGIPCFQLHYYPMDISGDVPQAIMPRLKLGSAYNKLTYSLTYLTVGGLEYHYLHRWRKLNGMRARRIRARPDYTVGKWQIPVLYAISRQLVPRSLDWPRNINMIGFIQPRDPPPFEPSPALKAFLERNPKPLYIGFGSMTSGDMASALEVTVKSLKRLNLRAVMIKGWSGAARDANIPESARSSAQLFLADFVPHSWLFQRVGAVVHHGGAGTTAAGLYAGLPTLVIPFGADQPFWGEQVYRHGLGPKPIPRDKLDADRMTRALRHLVSNPAYRENAQYIARHLRIEDGASEAADVIERECAAFPRPAAGTQTRGRKSRKD
ncbi:MAG: glycosyltransferase [Oscillospiraceae bacterium]|jgi:UDP:flavonoid glycosyltransferase YjiC (YdhE family)|nr:glycosyltransferase [Oscillospiraceae bacterium]